MKNKNLLLVFLLPVVLQLGYSTAVQAQTANTWTQKANFAGTGRNSVVSFSVGTKGYIGLGQTYPVPHADMWEYDPTADIWTQKANMPASARELAASFVIGSIAYMGTGDNDSGAYYQDFWAFDPVANTWTQKASFPYGKSGAVGFSVGSKGYIVGGNSSTPGNDSWLADNYEYNPATDSWTVKAGVPGTRAWAVGFSIGNYGYVGTGHNNLGNHNDFYQYDPAADIWTQKANFGGAIRYIAMGTGTSSRGYIGTGYNGSFFNDWWEYNPISDAWTQKTNYPAGVENNATSFSIGDIAYAGVGASHGNVLYQYVPTGASVFYSAATGDLGTLSTYGTNTDGSGSHPTSFSTTGQEFHIANGHSAALSSALTLPSGSEFVFDVTDTLSGSALNATISVSSGVTLTISSDPTSIKIGPMSQTSTVTYINTSAVTIPAGVYGNLNIGAGGAGAKTLGSSPAQTVVTGNLNIATTDVGGFNIGSNTLSVKGNITNTGGTPADDFINAASGSLSLSGTSAQTVSSGIVGTVQNLTVSNTAGVTINNGVTVTSNLILGGGLFTLSSGILTVNSGGTVYPNGGTLAANPTYVGTVNILAQPFGIVTSGKELTPVTLSTLGSLRIASNIGTYKIAAGLNPTFTSLTIDWQSILDVGTNNITLSSTGASISGTFKHANTTGFSGGSATAITNTNSPTVTLIGGSVLEYAATNAPIDARTDYYDVAVDNGGKLSGNAVLSHMLTLGTSSTLSLDTNSLTIAYAPAGTGNINASAGTIVFSGYSQYTIPATLFGAYSIKNLTVNFSSFMFSTLTWNPLVTNVTGNLTLTSGIMNIGTNTLNIGGNASAVSGYSGGSLTATSGTVGFNGSGNQSIGSIFGGSVKNLVIANTGTSPSNVVTLASATSVTNSLTLTIGSLALASGSLTVAGKITRTTGSLAAPPIYSGNVEVSIGGTCTSGPEIAGTSGTLDTLSITAGTYTLSTSQSLSKLALTGTIALSSDTLTLTNIPFGTGNINASNGTLALNNAASYTIPATLFGSNSINNLVVAAGSGNNITWSPTSTNVTGTLTLTSGNIALGTDTFTIAAAPVGSGTIDGSTGTIGLNGSTYTLPSSTFVSNNIKNLILGASGTVTLGTATNVTGNLALNSGILNTGTNTLSIGGNATAVTGSITGSTVIFNGTANQSYGNIFNGGSIANLTIANTGTAPSNIVSPSGTPFSLAVSSALALNSGVFNIANVTLNSTSTWARTSGTIDASLGSIAFNNTSALSIPTGTFAGNTIYKLYVNDAAGVTIPDSIAVANYFSLNNSGVLTATTGISIAAPTMAYVSGALYTGSTGYLSLNGTAAQTVPSGIISSMPNLIINNASGVTFSSASSVSGSLKLVNGALSVTGGLTVAGTIYRIGGSLAASPIYSGTVNVTDSGSNTAGPELTGTGGTLGTVTVASGTYTLAANLAPPALALTGTLALGTNTLTLANAPTGTGNINATSGTITFTGSTYTLPATLFTGSIKNVTSAITGTLTFGAATTISTLLTLSNGTLAVSGGSLTAAGGITRVHGSLAASPVYSGAVNIINAGSNTSGPELTGTGGSIGGLTVVSGTYTLSTSVAPTSLTYNSGILNIGTNTLTLAAVPVNVGSSYIIATAGTVVLNGTSYTITSGTFNTNTVKNLIIGTSGTLTLGAATTVSNALTLRSGSLAISGGSLTVAGTITRVNGTLAASPVYSGVVNVTDSGTVTSANELTGTGGSIGVLTAASGTYTLASGLNPTFGSLVIPAAGTIDVGLNVLTLSSTGANISGTFIHANPNGFSGSSNTAISNTNSPTITLNPGSTVIFDGVGTPPVTPGTYSNLIVNSDAVITGNTVITGTLTLTGKLTVGSNALTISNFAGSPANSLVVTTASTLNIAGNLTSPLYFDTSSNTIGALNITGTATLGNDLNLTAGTTPGTLTVSGALNTGGNLTLMSDSNGTARIAPVTGSISGVVNIQRYVPGQRGYRLMGHPYTTNLDLSQLESFFDVTGIAGAGSGCVNNNPSIFSYTPGAGSYTGITNGTGAYPACASSSSHSNGILAFIRGAKGQDCSSADTTTPSNITFTTDAPVNQGDITESVPAGGWNVIANPYPSQVILSSVTNIGSIDFIKIVDPAGQFTNPYTNCTQYITGSTSTVIPVNGAFLAHNPNTSDVALTFHETDKSSSAAANNVFKKTSIYPILELAVYKGTHFWDNWDMILKPGTSENANDNGDVDKISNSQFDLYSVSKDNINLNMDARDGDSIADGAIVALGLRSVPKNTYTLTVSQYTIPTTKTVYLHDKYLETYTLLTNGLSYPFTVNADATSQGNRMELLFNNNTNTNGTGVSNVYGSTAGSIAIVPNPATTNINVNYSGSYTGAKDIVITNVVGQVVKTLSTEAQNIIIPVADLPTGVYLLKTTVNGKLLTQRFLKN